MPARDGTPALPMGALLLILVVVFINFAGFSIIIPLLPFYGTALSASPTEVAILFAAYSFGGIFGEIWWGRVSDRHGRKTVLAGATFCAALTYFAFAFASHLWLAVAIRVATGFFSGTVGVCQSYIADVTAPEQRARSVGFLGAALNLGFAFGPAIGGLLADTDAGLAGFRLPILAAGVVALLSSAWCFFALAETHAPGKARPLPNWGQAFGIVTGNPMLLRLFLIAGIGIGTFASMEAVFGLWTERNFGWTAEEVGLTFLAVGTTGFLVQVLLIGHAVAHFGEARVIACGLVVLMLSMMLQPVLRDPIAAVVLMSTLMGGHSIAFPTSGALISRSIGPEVQGSINGLLMSTNALGRIALPPVFGGIYSLGSDLPYFAGALLVAFAVLIALQVVRIRDVQLKERAV